MLSKSLKVFLSFITLLLLLQSCEENKVTDPIAPQTPEYTQSNPHPSDLEPLPEIKFDLGTLPEYSGGLKNAEISSLVPSELQAVLSPGESIIESKTGHIASSPPKADIMMSFDLSGSMMGAVNQAKANAISIIGGVRSLIPDSYFGVMSHIDYNGFYDYCSYSSLYGFGPDYPYLLGQSLTENASDVSAAISGLLLGEGADGYENYTRIFYEAYADAVIGWRDGSKRILLAWLDNYPHDCDIDLGYGVVSTGVDPGRDAIAGTGDDLDFDDVLLEMQDNNITPIVITSASWNLTFWQTHMQSIGGNAYDLGADIVNQIVDIIEAEFNVLDEVKLEPCDPAYSDWVSCSPEYIGPKDVSSGADVDFVVTITVPLDTPSGTYEFDICLIGDGAEYARQHVSITVVEKVPADLFPEDCPNLFNTKAGGLLPLAILGTSNFDVTIVDPESVTVEGVSPVRWALEDVATPYEPYINKPLEAIACNNPAMDGFQDLTLKYNKQEIVRALEAKYGPLVKGQVLRIHIEGLYMDGRVFIGEDIFVVER